MSSGQDDLLVVDNLLVRYRGGAIGVADVSLRVGVGQVVALLGPNGAGKTTTVRAISGFMKTEGARIVRGTVRLDGQDTTGWEPHRLARRGVVVVPERKKVFANLTVAENLRSLDKLPPRERRAAIDERIFTLFPVLAGRLGEAAGRLSGGQQQMLSLARALVAEPRLLIVDEMTLGLHVSLHQVLYDAITAIAATGTSVLVVDESTTFALSTAHHCYVLRSGRVVGSGSAPELASGGLLASSYVGGAA
jgi:branched-chain amino acid transport system ATP-binding protein